MPIEAEAQDGPSPLPLQSGSPRAFSVINRTLDEPFITNQMRSGMNLFWHQVVGLLVSSSSNGLEVWDLGDTTKKEKYFFYSVVSYYKNKDYKLRKMSLTNGSQISIKKPSKVIADAVGTSERWVMSA
jgi:hypothetical protein